MLRFDAPGIVELSILILWAYWLFSGDFSDITLWILLYNWLCYGVFILMENYPGYKQKIRSYRNV